MGAYPGMAFHASIPLGRSDCTISLRGHELVGVLATGVELRVDLRQAVFECRSSGVDTLCVTTRSPGGPVLTTQNMALLREIQDARIPEFDILIEARGQTPARRWARRAIVLAIFAFVLIGVPWFLVGYLPRIVVGVIPRSVDREIGTIARKSLVEALGSNGTDVQDRAVREPVTQIVDRLTSVADREGFEFEVTIVQSDIVNAFALPGGKIVVTTGLLELADSPEEVAGVLAHEVCHVTGRHTVLMLVKNLGIVMAIAAIFSDSGSITQVMMEQAADLTALSFSRACEEEADKEAVHLLARARVEASGLRTFLEKMEAREKGHGRGESVERFLSTHPVTKDRLEDIDAERRDVGAYTAKPLDVDWAALKAALARSR